jgi:hypothetical protein
MLGIFEGKVWGQSAGSFGEILVSVRPDGRLPQPCGPNPSHADCWPTGLGKIVLAGGWLGAAAPEFRS